ncbi:MAG TPA: alpha/beta hydrolase, partial [Candidatus Acidoferrum sp.]|nr:alpha/beta hydrolase [Candidatus Acidoferrum sp.]
SPTVLLSPGAGDFSVDWALVQPRVAQFARVCSYDRSGDAWSDAGPAPNTMRQEVSDLHRALRESGERGPYILVGHSLGGLVMRVFVENFPDETAGLVLVDATSEDTTLSMNGKLVHVRLTAKDRPIPPVQTMKSGPPVPLTAQDIKDFEDFRKQFGAPKIEPPFDQLPPDAQKLDLWARSQMPKSKPSDNYFAEELQHLYERSQKPPAPLGDKPLITIVAARPDPPPNGVTAAEWQRLVNEKVNEKRAFANLSTNSKVIMDEKSGHHIHLDDPGTVVSAIRSICDAAQHHTRLPQ